MRIFGRNPPTHANATFEHSYLSGVHLHCDALHYFPTMDGYTEMCGFQYFTPHPVQRLASAITSPSPRILNLCRAKTFQMRVPFAHESVSALLSDGYITIHWPSLSEVTTTEIHWFHGSLWGRDSWQHRRHTDRHWRAVSEDTHIIRYWLLHYTASIGRVTIPSNRADHPTLDLHCTDQHTPPLSPTVGLLVWQSGSIRPVFNLSYLMQAGFAMQMQKNRNKQSINLYL